MKKRSLLLFPALLFMFLTACGGDKTPSTPSEDPSGGETEPGGGTDPSGDDPSGGGVDPAKTQYTITFKDENGNELESNKWDEGSTPSYLYEKADTAEWDYTVDGWSLTQGGEVITIPAASADATYFAVVSQVKRSYTITFDSNGGSSVASITEEYGTSISKPTDPELEGYNFVAWSTDKAGENKVTWPYTLQGDITFYANWNEKVNIKAYFQALLQVVGHDPYSYIPETMKPDYSANHVSESEVTYNFENFTNVSSIKYGGFGEQWHMVIENIEESEKFYSVLSLGETAMNASVALFNDYLDSNPDDTASHSLNETTYSAMIDFHNGILQYSIRYKTNLNIPFFGEVTPQIDMIYNVATLEKAVRIQLTENNAMKYIVTDDHYVFGIEYGVTEVSRKAYCQIDRLEDESIQGHIYEFVQYKGKELMPACADFYIDEEYVSAVGNKASGLTGFTGYINELYDVTTGKLAGYKVKETFSLPVIGEKTYNTLWFNLSNITGINSVKAVSNGSVDPHENHHDIYLNGSSSVFEPMKNKYLLVNTSRKYDVEMRKQFFYGYKDDVLTKYEREIPMMFIQDDGTESGEDNYSTFEDDISSKNGIDASVNLASKYLNKIREDYLSLIDVFISHKDDVTGTTITGYIGSAYIFE